jgi:hypothetical protein
MEARKRPGVPSKRDQSSTKRREMAKRRAT